MNDLEDKLQIDSMVGKENTKLSRLKDRVDKYHDLSSSMSSILTTFELRLGKLEQTILPVYNETEHLQNRFKNLDSTLQCLETVLSHYDASQEVCNLIHIGPSEGNITEFLSALNKLKNAKDYFFYNNAQSVELENVTSLFNTGCETLNNHYKMLLKKHSHPLKSVDLLDLIYIEDDSSTEDCSSLKQLAPSTREELNAISNWLDYNLRREYMQIYADERSEVVFRSLQILKDHQKSSSWGTETLKVRQYGRNEPKKSTSARLQSIFERKANKMLLKASQTIESSTGFALKKNTNIGDNLTVEDYNLDGDQELEKYLVLLLGLQRLLIWERQLLNEIIPTSRHTEVFSRLSQSSIDMLVKDAESITNKVLRNIARKEWSSALGVFSALKRVILLQPDLDRACDATQRQQLGSVLKKLQQTGSKALDQFLDLVKCDTVTNLVGMSAGTLSGSNIPKDATVHELTSNTIWFIEHPSYVAFESVIHEFGSSRSFTSETVNYGNLRKVAKIQKMLLEHYDVIGGILQQDSTYSSQINLQKILSAEDRNKAILGLYIKKVLSELNLTIISKCEQYSDNATKHLFRLNNIHYILKSLQRSNLLDIVTFTEPDCERSYQELIQELKNSYRKSWSRLVVNISPLDDLPRPINGKVKEKERAIIKDRFSNFNKELEEACKNQRGISVPDVLLREGLKRDNAEHVIPQYNAFFEIYSDVQFSKSPDKYVKYRPQDVSAMLNSLFDDRV